MCPKVTIRHKEEVRGKIIQSAIECFSKNGFDKTKMDDVALSADVSKGTLYNYFDNKESLFQALCTDSLNLLKVQLDNLFTNNKDDLISNAEMFYDNFQKIQKEGTSKVFFEALSESTRSPKLQHILFNHRLNIYKVVENYIQIQVDKGFLNLKSEPSYVAAGLVSLFDGIMAARLLGLPDEYNRKVWSVTAKSLLSTME
ncbi:MAG: TetR/AcrR family transcriptional regulator [Candidatus Nitrosocosmicus sp.]